MNPKHLLRVVERRAGISCVPIGRRRRPPLPLLAIWIPARHALAIDPAGLLREE
jgi:hypothetical protein